MVASFVRSASPASVLRKRLVRIAGEPPLAGLRGSDHRVTRAMRVLARVALGRGIPAARHAAGLARAEVHPGRSDVDAGVTGTFGWGDHRLDCGDVGTGRGCHRLSPWAPVRMYHPRGGCMHWSDLWIPGEPILAKILRPLVIYVFLVVSLRVAGK